MDSVVLGYVILFLSMAYSYTDCNYLYLSAAFPWPGSWEKNAIVTTLTLTILSRGKEGQMQT